MEEKTMINTSINKNDAAEAEQHILLALGEMENHLPKTHEELIEKMRFYFEDQRVEVFSRLINAVGENGFRDFVANAVIKSGKYSYDEAQQIRPVQALKD